VSDVLRLCFGVHDHQPVGNFDQVNHEATERAYRPFFELIRRRPELRLTVHVTGSLLEWLRERAPDTFDVLGTIAAAGQAELLTGGFYEPILAILPDHDKVGQVRHLTDYLKRHFGVRPRGMWLAERVWEPHLPKALVEAGVEYVVVDDSHFSLAGFDPEALGGWYVTEDQGHAIGIFPISQRLRYLIPFADVEETARDLERRRGRAPSVTVMDDGEKFGAWPGTHDHVYRDGWLDRFFDRVARIEGIRLATLSDVRDQVPASGRAYLPTASYREMGEWTLGIGAGRDLQRVKQHMAELEGGDALTALLRGGFWRSFLVKYPEVADTYWRMLRLSEAIEQELARRPDDARLHQARRALWRGQANDAYWHGIFGGCYLPHLRRAVKQSLLEAEHGLGRVTGRARIAWARGDLNGDGADEIVVRTSSATVTVNPDRGGTVTELALLERALDVGDVLTRRSELYHEQIRNAAADAPAVDAGGGPLPHKESDLTRHLGYDALRRASLTDGWFESDTAVDPLSPWPAARFLLASERLVTSIEEERQGVAITMRTAPGRPVRVEKRVTVRDATVEARYRIGMAGGAPLRGTWVVQWNLALTAGHAADRYFSLPERPTLATPGRVTRTRVGLVDEWAGVAIDLRATPAAAFAWAPVETVSVSEGGFERIYQGTAITLAWPLDGAGAEAELLTRATLRVLAPSC
jgi:alpha-amylase